MLMIQAPKIKVNFKPQYFILIGLLLLASFRVNFVSALSSNELRAQSNNIQSEIENNKVKAQELANQASSLRRTIDNLDLEIDSQAKEIELLGLKIEGLNNDLDKANTDLERQKGLLKAALRALYQRQGVSTVELLVASDSFSDFINDQEYLQRLQAAVKQSTDDFLKMGIPGKLKQLQCYEQVKDKLFIRLLNVEKNKEEILSTTE